MRLVAHGNGRKRMRHLLLLLVCVVGWTSLYPAHSHASGEGEAVTDAAGARTYGELRISGESVKHLRLVRREGDFEISDPEGSTMVPVGVYGRQEVVLKADDSSNIMIGYGWKPLVISEGILTVIDVGGPFRQGIELMRTGRMMHFHSPYLADAGGAKYLFPVNDRNSIAPVSSKRVMDALETERSQGGKVISLSSITGSEWQYWFVDKSGAECSPLSYSIYMSGIRIAHGPADYG